MGDVFSTWSPVDNGHHLASCDTYISGRIMRVCDHQAPRAITSHRRRGSTARERPSALSHYTQSRSIVCMTARLDVTPKTTEQSRIVCTSKFEAEVTNNKNKTGLEVPVLYY